MRYNAYTVYVSVTRQDCHLQRPVIKWDVIVRFVDIAEIVDHHCLTFIFLMVQCILYKYIFISWSTFKDIRLLIYDLKPESVKISKLWSASRTMLSVYKIVNN
jgi:hypothetical protein